MTFGTPPIWKDTEEVLLRQGRDDQAPAPDCRVGRLLGFCAGGARQFLAAPFLLKQVKKTNSKDAFAFQVDNGVKLYD